MITWLPPHLPMGIECRSATGRAKSAKPSELSNLDFQKPPQKMSKMGAIEDRRVPFDDHLRNHGNETHT